jgi:hypothetical protein
LQLVNPAKKPTTRWELFAEGNDARLLALDVCHSCSRAPAALPREGAVALARPTDASQATPEVGVDGPSAHFEQGSRDIRNPQLVEL